MTGNPRSPGKENLAPAIPETSRQYEWFCGTLQR